MHKYINTYQHSLYAISSFNVIMILLFVLFSQLFFASPSPWHQYRVMAQTSSQLPSSLSNFGSYENSTYGVKFLYPLTWNKVETLAYPIIDIKFVVSPNQTLNFPATIDVSIEKSLGNITNLSDYANTSYKTLSTLLNNLTLIMSKPITLGGLPGIERIFVFERLGIIFETAQVFTMNNNKAYIITYSTHPSKFLDYFPIALQVVSSFQIIQSNKTNLGAS